MTATTEHTHTMIGCALVEDPCPACEAEAEGIELAQDISYLTRYGICSYVTYLQHCEAEAAIYERCLVAGFADDPITRSASFDGYEMAELTRPIRERCAAQGCLLCQEENV